MVWNRKNGGTLWGEGIYFCCMVTGNNLTEVLGQYLGGDLGGHLGYFYQTPSVYIFWKLQINMSGRKGVASSATNRTLATKIGIASPHLGALHFNIRLNTAMPGMSASITSRYSIV